MEEVNEEALLELRQAWCVGSEALRRQCLEREGWAQGEDIGGHEGAVLGEGNGQLAASTMGET